MKVHFTIGFRFIYAFRRIWLAASVRSGLAEVHDLDRVFSDAGINREPGEVAVVHHLATSLGFGRLIDVGANHGDFSRHLNLEALSILLVEPNPILIGFLQQWAARRREVKVLHAAVSERKGTVELFVPAGHTGGASVSASTPEGRIGNMVRVDAFPLSSLLESYGADFVKIDVEGHELRVFEGAIDYIKTHGSKCVFGFECAEPSIFDKIHDLLPDYVFYTLDAYWPAGKRAWGFAVGLLRFLLRTSWEVRRITSIDGYEGMIFAVPIDGPSAQLLEESGSIATVTRASMSTLG